MPHVHTQTRLNGERIAEVWQELKRLRTFKKNIKQRKKKNLERKQAKKTQARQNR